jgi:hypothetical protein
MTENQALALESDLRALRELKGSRGWVILMDAVKDDVFSACLQMADNPVMTEKEIDFRRGAISAARNFVNSIDALISRAENEILLASATQQTQFDLNAKA